MWFISIPVWRLQMRSEFDCPMRVFCRLVWPPSASSTINAFESSIIEEWTPSVWNQ